MEKIRDKYHDANHAVVIIKRTAKSLEPIIDRVIKHCRDNELDEIASPKQLDIAQISMKTIGEQCEILLQWIDEADKVPGER